MNARSGVINAGVAAVIAVLCTLGASFVFPALANPIALALGAVAGVALVFRERLQLRSPGLRFGIGLVAVAVAASLWLSLQPGYLAI